MDHYGFYIIGLFLCVGKIIGKGGKTCKEAGIAHIIGGNNDDNDDSRDNTNKESID